MVKHMTNNSKNGFTLIEIIVVLVILAVLAAILIPSLSGYIRVANDKVAIAECRHAVLAAQTVSSEYYAENGSIQPDFLEIPQYKAMVENLAEVNGVIQGIVINSPDAKIRKLVYYLQNGLTVTYDIDADELYTVSYGDMVLAGSAPGMNAIANQMLADSEVIPDLKKNSDKTQELQRLFLEAYGESYPYLSDSEQLILSSLGYKYPEELDWRPIIAGSGEVIMVASKSPVTVANPLGSMIYYQGNYYYWYHINTVKTSYVSDNNFDISQLDSTKTELGPGDSRGAWLVYAP